METKRGYHERRAREQRERAATAQDPHHRAIHEELARLHDVAAENDGHHSDI
jgi:hypothetical protein